MLSIPIRFRYRLFVLSLLGSSLAAGCAQPDEPPEEQQPERWGETPDVETTITTVGHGRFIDRDGNVLAPSLDLFQRTQSRYIQALEQKADGALPADATRAMLASYVQDQLLADALYIDWLVAEVEPVQRATMTAVNEAMRRHYLDELNPSSLDPAERTRTKGVGDAVFAKLAAQGFTLDVSRVATTASGEKYIRQCAAAGVPIPPPMFSDEWVNRGEFENEFLAEGKQAELMYYESQEPPGVCLALPRYFAGTDEIDVFGVICLGTLSNKACFWDNPWDTTFRRGEPIEITEFVGGYDLDANGQGVCSDCHAGENPFVVHPEKSAFSGLSAFGTDWYEPIVHPDWPQNPGPTSLLAAVSSTQRCDDCHSAGLSGGRFPAVSQELPGYCGAVLQTAAFTVSAKTTMPPYGMDRNNFVTHIEALRDACDTPPSSGTIVPVDEIRDTPFLSPPAVIDPLYACAEQVAVRGAVLDASLTLYVDGNPVGTKIARNPDQEVFTVPPLVVGQKVTAEQTVGGVTATSETVFVRDHSEDYPDGLPAPSIDPTLIHECAGVIAVRHVPGARVTVYTNGGDPVTVSTATGWTSIWPGKQPFAIGDEFTAEISLCSDRSKLSEKEAAVAEPSIIPAPSFDPPQTFAGQELITIKSLTNGSRTKVEVSGSSAGGFSTPVSWRPNYDLASKLGRALNTGDVVVAQQQLCSEGKPTETPPASDCRELPAPRISAAIAGTDFVVVEQAVPGARIRVYDGSNTEIGDGSGTVINLSRTLVSGDELTVVQQVGECTSQTGYQVIVRQTKG